jgi:uncharacterized membrane protein YoaK (UPF0700 family)
VSASPIAPASPRRLSPTRVRDLVLVGLAVSSGAVDAISYLALDKVFTAFMTGNIVFLGLRVGHADIQDLLRVCVALVAFAAGSFLAIKVVSPTMSSSMWPRRVSVALGIGALLQLVFLVVWIACSGRPATGTGHLLTGISAVAMGVQTGAIVSLGLRAVFTTAVTATVVNLMGDFAGWPLTTRERGRFAGVLIGIVAGAAAGTALLSATRTFAPVLPLVVSLLAIAIAYRWLAPEPD